MVALSLKLIATLRGAAHPSRTGAAAFGRGQDAACRPVAQSPVHTDRQPLRPHLGGGNGNASVACLAGERVIGGGNDSSSVSSIFIVASRDNGNGWSVFAHNNAAGANTVTVHAYCLEVS
jgi:hypothetical protein